LKQFVPAESIPPIYFERGYFLTPAAGFAKSLQAACRDDGQERARRHRHVCDARERILVAIFSDKGILRAETMRFADELRSPSDIGLPKKKEAPKATVHKFEKLISTRSKKQFSPSKLEDKQTESL
jgi:DNA end-binding protein Ku